jgi:hypothetical protein
MISCNLKLNIYSLYITSCAKSIISLFSFFLCVFVDVTNNNNIIIFLRKQSWSDTHGHQLLEHQLSGIW